MISKFITIFILFVCFESIFSLVIRSTDETLDEQLATMWSRVNKTKNKLEEHKTRVIGKANRLGPESVEQINVLINSCLQQFTQEFQNIEKEARKTGHLQYDIPEIVGLRIVISKYPEVHNVLMSSFEKLPYPLEMKTKQDIERISSQMLNETLNNMQDLYDEIHAHQDIWRNVDVPFELSFYTEEKDPSKYNEETLAAFSRAKIIIDKHKKMNDEKIKIIQAILTADVIKKVRSNH